MSVCILEARSWAEVQRAWAERCKFCGPLQIAAEDDRRAWNSWCYQFHHMGFGAYLACDGCDKMCVVIMRNTSYKAPYPPLRVPGKRNATAVQKCVDLQRRNFPRKKWVRIREHDSTWSLNGPLLDNWDGDGQLFDSRLREMVEAVRRANQLRGGGRFQVMLNRRDYPQMAVNLRDPFLRFTGRSTRECAAGVWQRYARPCTLHNHGAFYDMLPIFSQYTLPSFADIAVPPIRTVNDTPPTPPEWSSRKPMAIFRGTATSPHRDRDSQRLRAYALLRDCPFADVRLTGLSARFRVCDGAVHVTNHHDAKWRDVGQQHFLTLDEQAKRCRWALYIEGNAGADRFAELLAREFLVIAVDSDAPVVSWLRDRRVQANVHYLRCASVEELPKLLAWCAKNPERCRTIAKSGLDAYQQFMTPEGVALAFVSALSSPPPPPWRLPVNPHCHSPWSPGNRSEATQGNVRLVADEVRADQVKRKRVGS